MSTIRRSRTWVTLIEYGADERPMLRRVPENGDPPGELPVTRVRLSWYHGAGGLSGTWTHGPDAEITCRHADGLTTSHHLTRGDEWPEWVRRLADEHGPRRWPDTAPNPSRVEQRLRATADFLRTPPVSTHAPAQGPDTTARIELTIDPRELLLRLRSYPDQLANTEVGWRWLRHGTIPCCWAHTPCPRHGLQPEIEPNACDACDRPERSHGRLWHPIRGVHTWIEPPDRVRLARMRARRQARVERGRDSTTAITPTVLDRLYWDVVGAMYDQMSYRELRQPPIAAWSPRVAFATLRQALERIRGMVSEQLGAAAPQAAEVKPATPAGLTSEDLTRMTIRNGWIVCDTGEHNCAGGTVEASGIHEPACGLEPVAPLEEALRALDDVARLTAERDRAVAELAGLREQVTAELDAAHEPATHAAMLGLMRRVRAIVAPGSSTGDESPGPGTGGCVQVSPTVRVLHAASHPPQCPRRHGAPRCDCVA
jgi:hypothetical protein